MSDWREVRISELSTIDIGGTPSRAISAFWVEKPVGHPWISIADLKGKYVFETKEHITALGVRSSNVKLIPANTTVMSFKLTVGRTAITGREMFCNEAIAIFQPKDERLNGQWLYHALPKAATSVVTDTAVKGATLNKAKMAEMTLNLPPLVEQIKIAEILDTLDTAIHETEAIIAKLKAVKQGLLHDLLTRGIAANGELRPPQAEAPHLYQQSPLGWIPKEWNSQELHEMVATDSPITYGVVQPGPEIEGGVPFIRGGDIYGGRILVEQLRTISQRISNGYRRTKLRGGELLMSLVGYPGEVGIVPIGLAGANIARQAALIRLADPALASYVMHYLSSKGGKRQILGQSLGSAQQVVNLGDLRTVQIPLPLPDESAEVACRIGAANQRIDQEIGELNKLRKLKAALMDDLLTGRVRVTPLLEAAAP